MATTEKWAKLFKSRHQYADSVPVQFGNAKDAAFNWDGTNLQLLPVADDTGAFNIGDGTTDMDVKIFMNTSAKYVLFDQSLSAVTFVATTLTLGADTTGTDFKLFGATTGNYLLWDASEDDLTLVGTATQLAVAGTTASSSTTTGSLRTAGGLGVAGAAYFGGAVDITAAAGGLSATSSTLHATTGRVGKFSGTVAAPNQGDGYGAFEVDITASGIAAGMTNAFSSWLNFAASATPGANTFCAQNNGIYLPNPITATSAKMIMGMRMHYVADDGAAPGSLFLFSTNIYSNVLTALFDVNALVDMGGTTGAATTNGYKIPLFKDASANKVWYVNVYDG